MCLRAKLKRQYEADGIRLKEVDLAGLVRKKWKILSKEERHQYAQQSYHLWNCDPNYKVVDVPPASSPNIRGGVCRGGNGVVADIPILNQRLNTWGALPETKEMQLLGRRIMAWQLAKQIGSISPTDAVVGKITTPDVVNAINESSRQMREELQSFGRFKDEEEVQAAIDSYGFSLVSDNLGENVKHTPRRPPRPREAPPPSTDKSPPSEPGVIRSNKRSRRLLVSQSSQYEHVWPDDYRPHKWKTYVRHRDGKFQFFGGFDTEEEAARAHDVVARKVYGDDVACNFDEFGNRTSTKKPRVHKPMA